MRFPGFPKREKRQKRFVSDHAQTADGLRVQLAPNQTGNAVAVLTANPSGSTIFSVSTAGVVTATSYSGSGSGLTGVVKKYSNTIGDGAATTITIAQSTHSLATDRTNMALIMDATTGDQADTLITYGSNGDVIFKFNTAPTSNQYRVVIEG